MIFPPEPWFQRTPTFAANESPRRRPRPGREPPPDPDQVLRTGRPPPSATSRWFSEERHVCQHGHAEHLGHFVRIAECVGIFLEQESQPDAQSHANQGAKCEAANQNRKDLVGEAGLGQFDHSRTTLVFHQADAGHLFFELVEQFACTFDLPYVRVVLLFLLGKFGRTDILVGNLLVNLGNLAVEQIDLGFTGENDCTDSLLRTSLWSIVPTFQPTSTRRFGSFPFRPAASVRPSSSPIPHRGP